MRTTAMSAMLALGMMVTALGAHAEYLLRLHGDAVQGGMLMGRTSPQATVALGDREVSVGEEGRFVIGFGRGAPATARLRVTWPDGHVESREILVDQRDYEIQRIDGLPSNEVTLDEETLRRVRREGAQIAEARQPDSPMTAFDEQWLWPVEGIITGIYGSQRILNGKPRSPHSGVDIAAPKGTPVVAPVAGVVRLAEPDLFFSGGTVILDHGHGISSTYVHLIDIRVEPGDRVSRGEIIGDVGATGRATGPNLHWGVNWFAVDLDPALLVPPMPAE